jgi:hypothetical protein
VAVPSTPVVALGGEMPPELAPKFTVAPLISAVPESRTKAVFVADSLPSLRIETLLLVTVTVATVAVGAVPAGVPGRNASSEPPPPQPARRAAAQNITTVESFRIVFT